MNKKIWIWLSVLALGVGAVMGLVISLTRQQDQVEIIEEFSYGDKTAIEGLTVWARMEYGYQAFWEITHTMGEGGETVVRPYTLVERDQIASVDSREHKTFMFLLAGDTSMEYTEEGMVQWVCGLETMVEDVAGRTATGSTHQETLYYCDYMEYYPMYFPCFSGEIYCKEGTEYVKMMGDWHRTPSFNHTMQQYFQIPVTAEDQVTIYVKKDEEGNVVVEDMDRSVGVCSPLMMYLEADDGWYFGFLRDSGEESMVDTSCIPGGNGIYFLPMEEENGHKCLKPEQLSTIISLEEDVWVTGIYTDESQSTLFVSIWKDGGEWLHIYDRHTLEKRQILDMNDFGALGSTVAIYPHDDFLLIDSNLYWLLERDEAGIYQLKFRVPQEIVHEQMVLGRPKQVLLQDAIMDFNGEQLLIGGWQFRKNSLDGQKQDGFYLSVYDETGLIYYGLYKTSLDTGRSYEDARYACEPDGYDNFSIAWK